MKPRRIYYEEFDRLLDKWWKYSRGGTANPPDTLFHYTTPRGLIGILEKKSLWASNVEFLNDTSEPSYAIEVLRSALGSVESELPQGSKTRDAIQNFWNMRPASLTPSLFVFCLCENGDLLSQWRGYGTHGCGYSLGFDGSEIKKLAIREKGQYLIKVNYDTKNQTEVAIRVFESMIKPCMEAEHHFNEFGEDGLSDKFERFLGKTLGMLNSEVIWQCANFKSPAFASEEEWRLVTFGDRRHDQYKYRVSGTTIVPYIELESGTLKLSTIKKVIIGPTLNWETSKNGVDYLFNQFSDAALGPSIERSEVPFRLP